MPIQRDGDEVLGNRPGLLLVAARLGALNVSEVVPTVTTVDIDPAHGLTAHEVDDRRLAWSLRAYEHLEPQFAPLEALVDDLPLRAPGTIDGDPLRRAPYALALASPLRR